MDRRTKRLCLVVAAQTGCLAVGLWMQHRFIRDSIHSAVENEAWSGLDARARECLSLLDSQALGAPAPESSRLEPLKSALGGKGAGMGHVMILDPRWRVIVAESGENRAQHASVSRGQKVSWNPSPDSSGRSSERVRGTLSLPDGPHLGLVQELAEGQGYLLVHLPTAKLKARSAALMSGLSALGGLTLLWMCVPLFAILYMVLGRTHGVGERERARSAADALRQAQDIVRTRDAVIFGLAKLADSRDPNTGGHLERISAYSTILASALRRHPNFRHEVTPTFLRLIGISSALHDIGKVGIEDGILLKAGSLTPAERRRIQNHTTIGADCLRDIERRLGSSNFLGMAREIACAHHERWDGTGYPNGLAGDAIPLAARIVAIADVYDALSSVRPYKEALPHEQCVSVIRSEAGRHLDPDLVEAWLKLESRFREIARRFGLQMRQDPDRHRRIESEIIREQDRRIEDEELIGTSAEVE